MLTLQLWDSGNSVTTLEPGTLVVRGSTDTVCTTGSEHNVPYKLFFRKRQLRFISLILVH